jgi:hypothetical protein
MCMERNVDDGQDWDVSYQAKSDISVVTKVHSQDTIKVLIGHLIEIGRSSLIFEYLPINVNPEDMNDSQCHVTLKITMSRSHFFMVEGWVVDDEVSPGQSFFGLHARRCKVVFLKRVLLSEIEQFILN